MFPINGLRLDNASRESSDASRYSITSPHPRLHVAPAKGRVAAGADETSAAHEARWGI